MGSWKIIPNWIQFPNYFQEKNSNQSTPGYKATLECNFPFPELTVQTMVLSMDIGGQHIRLKHLFRVEAH